MLNRGLTASKPTKTLQGKNALTAFMQVFFADKVIDRILTGGYEKNFIEKVQLSAKAMVKQIPDIIKKLQQDENAETKIAMWQQLLSIFKKLENTSTIKEFKAHSKKIDEISNLFTESAYFPQLIGSFLDKNARKNLSKIGQKELNDLADVFNFNLVIVNPQKKFLTGNIKDSKRPYIYLELNGNRYRSLQGDGSKLVDILIPEKNLVVEHQNVALEGKQPEKVIPKKIVSEEITIVEPTKSQSETATSNIVSKPHAVKPNNSSKVQLNQDEIVSISAIQDGNCAFNAFNLALVLEGGIDQVKLIGNSRNFTVTDHSQDFFTLAKELAENLYVQLVYNLIEDKTKKSKSSKPLFEAIKNFNLSPTHLNSIQKTLNGFGKEFLHALPWIESEDKLKDQLKNLAKKNPIFFQNFASIINRKMVVDELKKRMNAGVFDYKDYMDNVLFPEAMDEWKEILNHPSNKAKFKKNKDGILNEMFMALLKGVQSKYPNGNPKIVKDDIFIRMPFVREKFEKCLKENTIKNTKEIQYDKIFQEMNNWWLAEKNKKEISGKLLTHLADFGTWVGPQELKILADLFNVHFSVLAPMVQENSEELFSTESNIEDTQIDQNAPCVLLHHSGKHYDAVVHKKFLQDTKLPNENFASDLPQNNLKTFGKSLPQNPPTLKSSLIEKENDTETAKTKSKPVITKDPGIKNSKDVIQQLKKEQPQVPNANTQHKVQTAEVKNDEVNSQSNSHQNPVQKVNVATEKKESHANQSQMEGKAELEVNKSNAKKLAEFLNQNGAKADKSGAKKPYDVKPETTGFVFEYEQAEIFRTEGNLFKTTQSNVDVFTDMLLTYKKLNNNFLPSIKPADGTKDEWIKACEKVGYEKDQIDKIFSSAPASPRPR